MNEGTLALLVPFAFFLLVGFSIWALLQFKQKARAEAQQTIRLAMERNTELTPELVSQLNTLERHPQKDLRAGIVWTALSVGLALTVIFLPNQTDTTMGLGFAVASIPLMIGLAYLLMHHFANKGRAAPLA